MREVITARVESAWAGRLRSHCGCLRTCGGTDNALFLLVGVARSERYTSRVRSPLVYRIGFSERGGVALTSIARRQLCVQAMD